MYTSWSSLDSSIHLVGVSATVWKYLNSKFGSCVVEPAAHVQTIKIFESDLFSLRYCKPTQSRHARRFSILKSIRKPKNTVVRSPLKLGVNTPCSMANRSMSLPSPNSFSIERYHAHKIPGTKLSYHDEGHKNLVSGSNFSFFNLTFWHVIWSALAQDNFCFIFFDYISAKISAGFSTFLSWLDQFVWASMLWERATWN